MALKTMKTRMVYRDGYWRLFIENAEGTQQWWSNRYTYSWDLMNDLITGDLEIK